MFLLVYGASASDVTHLETVKGRPPKGARGTVAPLGPRKPPKRRRTRLGALTRLSPGQGALWSETRASCQLSSCATQGRVRPRGEASDDCSSWFMAQVHLTTRVLRQCKGVLPCGRSDAARRAKALDSGPRGALSGISRLLYPSSPRNTGPCPTSGDASDDCCPWFMVQNTPTPRVWRRC